MPTTGTAELCAKLCKENNCAAWMWYKPDYYYKKFRSGCSLYEAGHGGLISASKGSLAAIACAGKTDIISFYYTPAIVFTGRILPPSPIKVDTFFSKISEGDYQWRYVSCMDMQVINQLRSHSHKCHVS